MTDPKQSAFLAEYKALCERHGLMLASEVFDPLTVERLGEGEDPLDHIGESGDEPWPDDSGQLHLYSGTPEKPGPLLMTFGIVEPWPEPPDFSQAFTDYLSATEPRVIKATKITDPLD